MRPIRSVSRPRITSPWSKVLTWRGLIVQDLEWFCKIVRALVSVNPKLIITFENVWNPAGGMHHRPLVQEVIQEEFGCTLCKLNCK